MNTPLFGADGVRVPPHPAPFFAVRRWSMTHLQGPFDHLHDYDDWVAILRAAGQQIARYIGLAPQFGVNAIELTGRPGEGGIDLDWLTLGAGFPRAARTGAAADFIRMRQDVVRELARLARAQGLETWLWHHELHVPRTFCEAYPEIAGTEYRVCTSHPLVRELVTARVNEFFDAVPEVDGLVVSLAECWGLEILTDKGCQCPRCRDLTTAQRVRLVVDWLHAALRARGKRMTLRTFSHARYREILRHTELEMMKEAFSGLPRDIVLMSKYCPCDFYGYDYPDNPLITAFEGPHLVEFTLNRELIGGTYLPILTPNDLRNRFQHAKRAGCLGVVGRTDNPTLADDPWQTLDHPNAFNLYCFGRLAQDPDVTVDELWADYLPQRYPRVPAARLRRVLERTERIGPRVFLSLGHYGISYAHRVPHPFMQVARTLELFTLAKWLPEKEALYWRFQKQDPSLIPELLAEKDEAAALARKSLDELEPLREGFDSVLEFLQLRTGLLRAESAARFWREISDIYFTSRCLLAGTLSDDAGLFDASRRLFDLSASLRAHFGAQAWPTRQGPMRGVGAEQFVVECWRDRLYAFLGAPVPRAWLSALAGVDQFEEVFPPRGVEHLWRIALGCVEPEADADGLAATVLLEPGLAAVTAEDGALRLRRGDGATLRLPLRGRTELPELCGGPHRLRLRRDPARPDALSLTFPLEKTESCTPNT